MKTEIPIWDIEQQWDIGVLEQIINPEDKELKMMAKWRAKNQRAFCDDHKITFKSTKGWWAKCMVNTDRVLFWVVNNDGVIVGHVGLANFTKNSCELDNVIRGHKQSPGIMHFAVDNLIGWAFKKYKLKSMYLRTRFDNAHAIKFYELLDFRVDKKTLKQYSPLIRMKYEGLWIKLK